MAPGHIRRQTGRAAICYVAEKGGLCTPAGLDQQPRGLRDACEAVRPVMLLYRGIEP